MIKLSKSDEPDLLSNNKDHWTGEFIELKNANTKIPDSVRYRYRKKEIKDQLKNETSDKCAYCESKFSHVSPGDVEHITPVARRPELIFTWDNLTVSCNECNRRKGDYYSTEEPLINPFIDDPSEHLMPAGNFMFHQPGSKKGELTRRKLELNRAALVEKRQERLDSIMVLLDRWKSLEKDNNLSKLVEQELLQEANSDKEFSFTVQVFIRPHINAETNTS